ncbi:hypothetical protein HDU87_006427 [Geranomyces variabilis]|uniref:peptidylprolyl isomerase n=1 Tax=Geranomyces variabilis TaxID=109894 RepID=A0AAD5XP11_9FUNG|nr:hypothetical protein HDU87_006427 [Geranomyces variabilis]
MTAKQINPRVFFDLAIAGRPAGRIVFELFASAVPKTAENFRALCTGERGRSIVSGASLHYKGSAFHRIVADFMLQGGDFTSGDGKGGESIYGGEPFKDESFDLKHDKGFLLSMANRGPDTNGSQFFITTVPTPHLDGKHVVFGRVVSGQALVREVEALPVDKKSRPHDPVVISNCGELERVTVPAAALKKRKEATTEDKQRRASSDDEDSSDAERKRRRKSKKDKKRRKRSPSASSSESDSDASSSSASDSSRRKSKSKSKKSKSKKVRETPPPPPLVEEEYVGIAPPEDVEAGGNWLNRDYTKARPQRPLRRLPTEPRVDSAGRVVKGRGSLQFERDRFQRDFRRDDDHHRRPRGPRDTARRGSDDSRRRHNNDDKEDLRATIGRDRRGDRERERSRSRSPIRIRDERRGRSREDKRGHSREGEDRSRSRT